MTTQNRDGTRFDAAVSAVIAALTEGFGDRVRGKELTAATHLRDDLSLDSMDLLTLVAALEGDSGLPFVDESASSDGIQTVSALARLLAGRDARARDAAERLDP